MEATLRDILQKTENQREFTSALLKFLMKVPAYRPIEFEKVFPSIQYPRTHKFMVSTMVTIQAGNMLQPYRDVSFNTDATKFQILDIIGFTAIPSPK